MAQTVNEIYEKVIPIIGKEYTLPITSNKGLPGYFLEDLLGIPHTSNCLDCSDGELKIIPVKKLKNGTLVPKETMAITMLSKDDLKIHCFKTSKCYMKLNKMLIVPYLRSGDTIRFMKPVIVKDTEEYSEIYKVLETDYNEIKRGYMEDGILQSKTGTLLQNRTKGAGHGSISRAFYLRPMFIKKCVPLN